MITGSVKWFNPTKGYGFIAPENGSPDVFVHITDLPEGLDLLRTGDRVAFDVVQDRPGKAKATKLQLVE